MKTFEVVRLCMKVLGFLPSGSNPRANFFNFLLRSLYIIVILITFLSTLWYCLFESESFNELVGTLISVFHSILLLTWYYVYFLQRKKYLSFMTELETKIDRRCEDLNSDEIYKRIDNEFYSIAEKIYSIETKLVVPSYMFPIVFLSIFKYFSSNHSKESFQQLFPATYPFDWRTLHGYLACSILQMLFGPVTGSIFLSVLSLIMGFCVILAATVSDFEKSLYQTNENFATLKKDDFPEYIKRNLLHTFQLFFAMKMLTIRFSNSSKPIIFSYMVYSIVCFCMLFLQLEASLTHYNLIVILQLGGPTIVTVLLLYLFCYYGNHLTVQFSHFGDAVYQLNWYMLTSDQQKFLPTFLALIDKPVFLEGYGGIQCTCEVFTKIMKTTGSYFIVLQQFY